MNMLIKQLIERIGRMIQVIQWSDERDRMFRPILIPVNNGRQ
ncbi:hypothetical protein [Spirosoma aerophilum]